MKQVILSSLFFSLTPPLLANSVPASVPVTKQPKGMITPTVEPRVENGFGLSVDAAFTWWKSQVSGMSFAQTDSSVQSPHWKFVPGFKVGLGIDIDFDGWDLYAEYTWFRQGLTKGFAASEYGPGYSSFIHTNTSTGALSSMILTKASSTRKSQFNIVDLELGRNFFISKRLALRPNLGFKLARMFEKTTLREIQEGEMGFTNLNLSQQLSGVGIRAGIDTVWHLSRTFGFYGDLALTSLWSSIHNHCNSYVSDDGVQTDRLIPMKNQTILPVIEMGVGLSYMQWFANERYQLYAKAGWEEQIWIGYNYNTPSGTFNNTGNLTLQGLTTKLGLAF